MFFRKSKRTDSRKRRIESLIGAGTVISGDVQFSGGLRIDGEVRGNVRVIGDPHGRLVISEKGKVEGEIRVPHMIIAGTVIGPVIAEEYLELQSRSRIQGDIVYSHIELHLGAVVQGRMTQRDATQQQNVLKLAASN